MSTAMTIFVVFIAPMLAWAILNFLMNLFSGDKEWRE